MSKNPSEPAPIKQRFIACVQSTGRVGKSMVADGILSWLSFAGIPHAAIDTDVQHHTLSDRYKMHLLDATSSEDEFEQLLENLPESPTLIVDFPGNKTSKILEFAAHFQMLNPFGRPASRGISSRGLNLYSPPTAPTKIDNGQCAT